MGDLLKMYSLSASSERRMRVSLTRVMPLTGTVVAGVASETTSATAAVLAGAGAGSGAEATGKRLAAVALSGAEADAGALIAGDSFLATVTGSGLLESRLLIGTPAEGFDFCVVAATVSIFAAGL